MTGRFVMVVGPSGAGKDTILSEAHSRLRDDPAILFARRVITRPAAVGEEGHRSVTQAEFDDIEGRGGFALSWRAHGLSYGIPYAITEHLKRGGVAVANGSRGAIERARLRFPDMAVVLITASPEVLAHRLAGRGRETEAEIADRLRRNQEIAPVGPCVTTIHNEGTIEQATEELVRLLSRLVSPMAAATS